MSLPLPLPLAKVILLTKDAYDTIESFIQFYGYLFDFKNVVIVDNGSSDARVFDVYTKYMAQGVHVIIDRSSFANANVFMTQHMLALKGTCEFLLPMDTDEFLFFLPKQSDQSYAISREDVHAYLRSIPNNVSIIRYGQFYASSVQIKDEAYIQNNHMYSNPPLQMTKFWDQNWDKIIVRTNAFQRVHQWLHHVEVESGIKITSNTLGLLHFHKTGLKRDWERSVTLVSNTGYGYINFDIPEDIQMVLAKYYADMHVPIYHRLEYFYKILQRKLILQKFHVIVGRLPTPKEVTNLITLYPNHMESIIIDLFQNLNKYRNQNIPAINDARIEDVLFDEESEPFAFEIYHVANRLKML